MMYGLFIYVLSYNWCNLAMNNLSHWNLWRYHNIHIRGDVFQSLARPGRKQATATKLGIYSTYSPRSSIHFLARCSKFCKPLKKKNFRKLSVQPVLRGSNDLRVRRKMATFQFFFLVQGTGGSPTGRDPENRVGDQDFGSSSRSVSSEMQAPGEPGHWHARTRPPWWPRGGFPLKCPSIAPAEMSNTLCWYFGPLEDNHWGGCRLDPKKSRWELFSGFLQSEFFWAGWAAMPPLQW